MNPSDLRVVVPFNNPMRWRSRLANVRRTEDGLIAAGVDLVTVEMAYGDRPFDLPDREGVTRIRFRGNDVLWQKENLANLGLNAAGEWRFAATIDGDLLFHDNGWPARTLHALQLYPVVQISDQLVLLGPKGEHLEHRHSYMRRYRAERTRVRALDSVKFNVDIPIVPNGDGYPGAAWGYRRETFKALGGLLEVCVVGAGDQHMAWALTGTPDAALNVATPGYAAAVTTWRARAAAAVNRDVGLVPALAMHLWHGRHVDRRYPGRWKILKDNAYDPATDVTCGPDGLLRLTGNKPHLRDDLRAYFGSRNEDSTDGVHHRRHRHHHHHNGGYYDNDDDHWWEMLEFWEW
jgi:hypothetical protein